MPVPHEILRRCPSLITLVNIRTESPRYTDWYKQSEEEEDEQGQEDAEEEKGEDRQEHENDDGMK